MTELKINPRFEALKLSLERIINLPYWQEVDTDNTRFVLKQIKHDNKSDELVKLAKKFKKLIKSFDNDEEDKKWSGDKDIFKNILEELNKNKSLFEIVEEVKN